MVDTEEDRDCGLYVDSSPQTSHVLFRHTDTRASTETHAHRHIYIYTPVGTKAQRHRETQRETETDMSTYN